VPRPRLIERLNAGLPGQSDGFARKLTLISAPAGYGKTALLSKWISQSDIQSAWVSVDEGDNDLARFLAYVVAALQTVESRVGESWSDLLCAPQRPPTDEILTLLLNDLTDVENHLIACSALNTRTTLAPIRERG
jgi:LuxR family maltose regulon positive regulatory protein